MHLIASSGKDTTTDTLEKRLWQAAGQFRANSGLTRTDNANFLWIQLFHPALNEKGGAGFVMTNSASDARASEQELRRQLIESRAVQCVVASRAMN